MVTSRIVLDVLRPHHTWQASGESGEIRVSALFPSHQTFFTRGPQFILPTEFLPDGQLQEMHIGLGLVRATSSDALVHGFHGYALVIDLGHCVHMKAMCFSGHGLE